MNGNSLYNKKKTIKDNIDIIANRYLSNRKQGEIEYRPFLKTEIYDNRCGYNGPLFVNLHKLYSNAKNGNVVYVGTNIYSAEECDIIIHIWGNVVAYFKEKPVYDYSKTVLETNDKSYPLRIHVKKGDNGLLFMCRYVDGIEFEFSFMPSHPKFKVWSRDYLYHSRATILDKSFWREDGIAISRLYKENEEFDGHFTFPYKTEQGTDINFYDIFGADESGGIAYALTYALEDGNINLESNSRYSIFINGVKQDNNQRIQAAKGDIILIKVLRDIEWQFKYNENDSIGIPFLKSNRKNKWLIIGTFGDKMSFDTAFGPEIEISFAKPYINNSWKMVFWRLPGENVYLRAYMDTVFFAQWQYAIMVGHYGILKIAETFNDEKYKKYFCESISTMAKFYDYCQYEKSEFEFPNFLIKSMNLTELDYIGTIGMNMTELYKISPNSDVKYCISLLDDAAKNNVLRFDDGTYCRKSTMWADDLYMSAPFIVRLGLLKNDGSYFDECVKQYAGFKKRLFIKNKKIYSHIFFIDKGVPNNIPWGRANGWIINSLSDVCEHLPDSYDGKVELINMFVELSYGLKAFQDEDGLWHQVIDRMDSYQETSCTAMILLGLSRGLNYGWITRTDFGDVVDKAYSGILKNKISSDGNIYGVCRGSSCSMDVDYYMNLKDIDNDDHGIGVVLAAFAEYFKYKNANSQTDSL